MRRPAARLLTVLASLLPALPLATAADAAEPPRAPIVLAAASLQESMNAAADAWTRKGHLRPQISFAGSSALARQIEAGAPADVFVSADELWMDDVARRALLRPGTRVSFLRNALVLIAPQGSALRVPLTKNAPLLKALGPDGRLAVADTGAVPAGIYAKQSLIALGIWPALQPRLAPGDSVRAALAMVSHRIAPLGIVYATDAKADPGVRVVGVFPDKSHDPITYPIAVLAASRNPDAEGFRRFLISGEGKALFRRFGFGTR